MKGMDGCPVNYHPRTTKGQGTGLSSLLPRSAVDSQLSLLSDMPEGCRLQYLTWVRKKVKANKGRTIVLDNPSGATLRIGDQDDTMYRGEDDAHVVNSWGEFFLPEVVTMQVFGKVEWLSCPCDQLVLMTCEDKKIYGYDGEELHEVASSLKQLFEEGMTYPAKTSYYDGEVFKNMTEKDWARVLDGPVGKHLDQAHRKLEAELLSGLL